MVGGGGGVCFVSTSDSVAYARRVRGVAYGPGIHMHYPSTREGAYAAAANFRTVSHASPLDKTPMT